MNRPFQRGRNLWLLLLMSVAALFIFFIIQSPPRAELLTRPPGTRNPRLSFLGRWSGPVRSALQKLKSQLVGPPRRVALSGQLFDVEQTFSLNPIQLERLVASNKAGAQVWMLDTNQLSAVRAGLQRNATLISGLSVWTSDGIPSKMFSGDAVSVAGIPRQVGIEYDALPRTRRDVVDLTTFFTLTSAFTNHVGAPTLTNTVFIRTNLAVGARVQIPRNHSIFLLATNEVNGKRIGVIISPTIHEPGK
jgi:hypothetical protein